MSQPPQSFAIDPLMQQWCATLSAEMHKWPSVHMRSFFGMAGFYRGDVIFACLPEKRAFFSPYSIMVKLTAPAPALLKRLENDARINMSGNVGQKWYGYEMRSMQDVRDSILWLETAYQNARTRPAPAKQVATPKEMSIKKSQKKQKSKARGHAAGK